MIKNGKKQIDIHDFGDDPLVVNIDLVTKANRNFRTTLWTGEHMQVTLMSLKPGEDIGLERHDDVDQFIRIESGHATVKMGYDMSRLNYQRRADSNTAIIIPAGTWHNIYNTGNSALKLYSIYAPPQHPFGTEHKTREDAEH